jgi:hypothetical protein
MCPAHIAGALESHRDAAVAHAAHGCSYHSRITVRIHRKKGVDVPTQGVGDGCSEQSFCPKGIICTG